MRNKTLLLGLLVLAAAWLGPLPGLAREAFFAHMTMHVSVVALAAPLIAVGLAGSRYDPVRKMPLLFAPIPASVLELVVVWGWHAPALHHAARSHTGALVLEQGTFLLVGLVVWHNGGFLEVRPNRGKRHRRAFCRKGERHSLAYAPPSPGDERCLSM